jgi:short-subunit dehydrogenase
MEAMKVCVVGANSAIAQAVVERLQKEGHQFYLVARDQAKWQRLMADLTVRFARKVPGETLDAGDFAQHAPLLERAQAAMAGLDCLFVAHGTLGDQQQDQGCWPAIEQTLRINFLSAASLATAAANHFLAQGTPGLIAVISSVAGDRGRPSNYIYGSAKGALNLFLQGMRARLYRKGIHVLTIEPGFVRTPMTAHRGHGRLFATPEKVARDIVCAMRRRKDILYTPLWWWPIMFAIRHIPEWLFKRLPS